MVMTSDCGSESQSSSLCDGTKGYIMYKVYVKHVVIVFDTLYDKYEIFTYKTYDNAMNYMEHINKQYASKCAGYYPRYELNRLQELGSE